MKVRMLHGLRLICIVMLLITMLCIVEGSSFVLAGTGLEQGATDFGKDAKGEVEGNTKKALDSASDAIISVARIISYTIAIVTLMILGIKYMTSAPGDRADIKKHAVIYVVGAFILFALPSIIEALIKLSENFSK